MAVQRFYVNAAGNDGNDGRTRTTPWKTLTPFMGIVHARHRIEQGSFVQACLTDLIPTTYLLPRLSNIDIDVGAGIDIFGEQFTVLRAAVNIVAYNPPVSAEASATLVCAGGLGINVFRGKTCRIKGGNADGALFTISHHTDTTITVVRDWLHIYWTIAPGDQFEILAPVVTLNPNADEAPCIYNVKGTSAPGLSNAGLLFANVRLLPSKTAGFLYFTVADSNLALLGVEIPDGVTLVFSGGHLTNDVLFDMGAGPGQSAYPSERLPFGAKGVPAHSFPGFDEIARAATITGWVVGGNCNVEAVDQADAGLLGTFHLLQASAHNETRSHITFIGGDVGGGFCAKVGSSIDISANYSRTRITGGATPYGAGLDAQRDARIAYGGVDFVMASGTPMHAAVDGKIHEMASTYGSNTGGTQNGVGAWARWGGDIRFQTAPPFIAGSAGQDLKVGNQAPVAASTLAADHGIVDPDGTGARIYVGGG